LFKLALVLRYLRKRRITIFPIAGVALGVMALVVVMSVMQGFETDFRSRIRGIMPDMSLTFYDVGGFVGDVDGVVKRIEGVGEVRAVSPYVSGLGLAVVKVPAGDGGLYENVFNQYVNFQGFDFARQDKVLNLKKFLQYGEDSFAAHPYGKGGQVMPVIVGARIAKRKFEGVRVKTTDWGNLDRGMQIQLMTFTPSYERSKKTGLIVDVVSTGVYDIDEHTAYLPLDWARALREMPANSVNGIGIALKEYNEESVAAATKHIREALADIVAPGSFDISTWEEERRTFLTAVAMERRIMAFILFFFLVNAGFAISAILIMIVLEKVRDIGILRAMGASSSGVASIFLVYGVTIGLVGAALGLVAGVTFVENLDYIEQFIYQQTGWQPFPPNLYDLPEIPRILNWWMNFYIVATAVVVSFAASLIPAVRAAWLDPVEAIRYE